MINVGKIFSDSRAARRIVSTGVYSVTTFIVLKDKNGHRQI